LLSIAEAAAHLGISRQGIYKLMRRGDLAFVRVGYRPLFQPEEIAAFLDRNRIRYAPTPAPPPPPLASAPAPPPRSAPA
jgi:excisionase family DNA binding protein